MEIFSRYNVCSTLLTLSHRREQRKQRRASIDTEVGTKYAFKHYPRYQRWAESQKTDSDSASFSKTLVVAVYFLINNQKNTKRKQETKTMAEKQVTVTKRYTLKRAGIKKLTELIKKNERSLHLRLNFVCYRPT